MLFRLKNNFIPVAFLFLFSSIISAQTPPTLSATGNQVYCPQTSIAVVSDFQLTSGTSPVKTVFIQISEGYENGKDNLKLEGIHTNISASFNSLEGKLKLEWNNTSSSPNDTEFINAVKDVFFSSTSTNPVNNKSFSITVGEANYLPSTGHYYQYISAPLITWTVAKNTAANLPKYYGVLTPYLATITSKEEAQLCGEQAKGQGWIGGSDEGVEGTWKWVTGPEAGSTFWFGLWDGNSIGADYTYTNWAGNEPNDWPDGASIPGQENYAHVYDDGRWNDYPNYNSNIKGYIVEYGGMPGDPVLNVSASTKVYVPYIDSFTEGFNCGTGTVTLSANASSGDVMWFDSATSTIPLYTGETYTTTSISDTKTYYAIASENGCTTGERTPVTATIRTIPTITSVSAPTTICGVGSAPLTATASAGIINWYDSVSGGVLLGTGNSFTSPIITDTTAYYVDATENGCTTETREQVIIYVQYTDPPTVVETTQSFCDVENATLTDLIISGTAILWYENAIGGTPLNNDQILTNNTTYYASQTLSTCESNIRTSVNVEIFETVVPLDASDIPEIEACDSTSSGDDSDGYSTFDLTQNEAILLNGKNAEDFTFSYFTDENYLPASEISNPANFENTIENGQPIYVRISNNLDTTCFTEVSFEIEVNSLPEIESNVTLKNCDEDGNPDGYTDFNLTAADIFITKGDSNILVTYYLNFGDADQGLLPPLNPSPFNNATASTVYARAENNNGCYRVSTVALEVSVTSFPPGFNYTIEQCENDNTNDGFVSFDFTEATNYFISQLPPQNLSVHYFRNATDAQLSENEILPQDNYTNENTPNQTIYVRVQNEDDGACFGIGPHLTLIVNLRPEFDIEAIPNETVCLNLPPTTLTPTKETGIYSYEWFNEKNESLGVQTTITVSSGGTYSAIATSSFGCESFKQSITLIESNIATISEEDVSITDDSKNNTITINTANLGIGEYQYALDDNNFQSDPVFENVAAGIHSIFVKDLNGCGTTPPLKVSVIGYPKFFSPNNDGTNDYWQVEGVNSNFYPTAEIYIFNRFGKLITKINPNSRGWDGAFNSEALPADDYWFTVYLEDNEGVIREKKGHFSLIR